MKLNVFFAIAIRIIMLFLVGMLGTFLPELLNNYNPKILGDVYNTHYKFTDLGIRHYWLNILMGILFLLSLISLVMSIIKIINKNYNNVIKQ